MARIVEIRNAVVPISSAIANAYIDFSKMTASVVALVSDVERDGKPVVGYGFNSNGRYACKGLLDERFIPRLTAAEPEALLGGDGNIDPVRAWPLMMANEKPGGHGERSVAVGVLDMALWDLAAKLGQVPLWRLIADRWNGGKADERVFTYAAGGYYYPGKGLEALQAEMQSYLDRGYRVCKMKIGGVPLDQDIARIEAALAVVGEGRNLAVDANGRFDLETAIAYAEALTPYGLFWYEEPGDPLDYALQAELARHYGGAMACSAIRTRATCCAMGACGRTVTGCNSTRRCHTGWWNTSACWICCRSMVSAAPTACPMAATRWHCVLPPDWGWAATRAIRTCSTPLADLPIMCRSRTAWWGCTNAPVSASRRKRR
jgi:hypothetical protein